MLEYDIADILEERNLTLFSRMMQDAFEERVGNNRFFRIRALSRVWVWPRHPLLRRYRSLDPVAKALMAL
jgi:hypothetical protein